MPECDSRIDGQIDGNSDRSNTSASIAITLVIAPQVDTATAEALRYTWRAPSTKQRRTYISVGDGDRGARAPLPPPKKWKKNSGNFYIKFGHFSGKNRVLLENFVNFSGKRHTNSGILIIFRTRIM